MKRAVLLLSVLWGCSVPASTREAPTTPEVTTPADDPTSRGEPVTASSTASTPSTINARYAEQTDATRWARQFEREGREVHDRRTDILGALTLNPDSDVADVGAGTGLFTMALARAVSKGSVFAVDVQPYFLDHITKRASEASLTNVNTVLASQSSVGLPAASIDVAFFCDAYHHVEQPQSYLASVFAALRPGGRLVIIDYDRTDPAAGDWMKDHIRADPATFRAEVESAGFAFVRDVDILEENFFFVFEKPSAGP